MSTIRFAAGILCFVGALCLALVTFFAYAGHGWSRLNIFTYFSIEGMMALCSLYWAWIGKAIIVTRYGPMKAISWRGIAIRVLGVLLLSIVLMSCLYTYQMTSLELAEENQRKIMEGILPMPSDSGSGNR